MDSKFTITLNGKQVEALPGQTILDVARSHGVPIPALCHHKALVPRGSCRLCVVEDSGRVRASCTSPAEPGMNIVTESPRLRAAREMVLQLIFTGRNHYCMYCEVSGNCELQDLGYDFGMDHFTFPTYEKRFPVDNSHEFILLDHNRCVLCGRCIRACADQAGHYVLTEKSRGYRTLVVADLDVPLGSSSCVSCGSCVQVCPTGAFIEKRSAYQGKKEQIKTVQMACDRCPVGCTIEVHGNPETNSVVKIHGDWDAPPTFGLLCRTGRYLSLFDGRPRLTKAKFKEDSKVVDISLDKALSLFMSKVDQGRAYVDGSLYNEELTRLKELFPGRLFSLNPVTPPLPSTARIGDLGEADLFVLFRLDLDREYGALGSLVKKRVRDGAARLVLVDPAPEVFEKLPAERLSSEAFLARLDRVEEPARPSPCTGILTTRKRSPSENRKPPPALASRRDERPGADPARHRARSREGRHGLSFRREFPGDRRGKPRLPRLLHAPRERGDGKGRPGRAHPERFRKAGDPVQPGGGNHDAVGRRDSPGPGRHRETAAPIPEKR